MIHAGLNGLDVGAMAEAASGQLVSDYQAKKNPALDKIDAGMERALGLLGEEEAEAAPRSKKAAA